VREPGRPAAGDRPRVIVDFEIEDDVLLVVLRNIGPMPARRVRVSFDPSFRGIGGTVDISRLGLFQRLEFLAPGREIRALVDPLNAWLGRKDPAEPRVIRVTVEYSDGMGRRYRSRLHHDLGIWDDLPRWYARRPTIHREERDQWQSHANDHT